MSAWRSAMTPCGGLDTAHWMATLYLMRHGRAAADWASDLDPGLDASGWEQARRAADALAPLGPMPIIASPMRRTRETAAPLAQAWVIDALIEPRVGEVRSPVHDPPTRGRWLREIAARTWPELDDRLRAWRVDVLAALAELGRDSVVVTHFIAINVAVGAATGDDRVVGFSSDYCSITVVRQAGTGFELLERGLQGQTRVL